MTVSLIVAAASNDVIGKDGALPWHLPEDLRHFKRLTSGNVVVMGRLTHDSIVARLGRPLPDRRSVVITTRPLDEHPDVTPVTSVPEALATARALAAETDAEIFICGGASIYEQALPEVTRIHLTRIHRDVEGDTSMPEGWLTAFTEKSREDHPGHSFIEYTR
ncbi:dihydrofolate reductase [Actinocorallia sp. B10E7]|uniref:dihydrofolate reductase n=1 Tax=Actinocorallia sp. B10E7 TaxID=3153558 RepID=UPI00325C5583